MYGKPTFKLGPAYVREFTARSSGSDEIEDAVHRKILKIKCQGNKRIAILGYSWTISDIRSDNFNTLGGPMAFRLDVQEESPISTKSRRWSLGTIGLNINRGGARNDSVIFRLGEIVTLPGPILIKNGLIRVVPDSDTMQAVSMDVTLYLARAEIIEPLGDYNHSTHLTSGGRKTRRTAGNPVIRQTQGVQRR